MSKLKEYINLIPEGIKNLDKIIEGVYNNIRLKTLPRDQQEEIIRRRVICNGCEFMSKNMIEKGQLSTERTDNHCTMCGCPINTKTASLQANCGIESYNEENPQRPLPLKWESYDSKKH